MIYHFIEYNNRMFPNKKLQIYINHSIRHYHLSLGKNNYELQCDYNNINYNLLAIVPILNVKD